MDKVSLTALGRQHLAAAHDAHSGRSAHTVYGGHQHTLRQTPIALTAGTGLDDHGTSPGEATMPGIAWAGSADQVPTPAGMAARAIISSSPPPATVCTPSTNVSFCSLSPNLFSGKANPAMTTICLESAANNHGPDLLHPATGEGSHPTTTDSGD